MDGTLVINYKNYIKNIKIIKNNFYYYYYYYFIIYLFLLYLF